MKRAILLLLVVCFGIVTPSIASESQQIDRFVSDLLRDVPEVPSIGIAVVREGKTVYLREPRTGYYIGSTTKAYTGLACAILAQRGTLDLDVPITKYLPEAKLQNAPTLRALLTHTSGLENNGIVWRTSVTGEHTPAQLVSLLAYSKPGQPGFHYSNLGYVVASLAIERVTGKPWQDALRDLVFKPLGMNRTTAYMSEAKKKPMATAYLVNRKGAVEVVSLTKTDRTMHAAGGIVTTPEDLAKWLNANIEAGGGGIPHAAFAAAQAMQVPATLQRGDLTARGYGFGWYIGELKGENARFHQGGYAGWQSSFSFLPDKKIGAGIMINASGPISQRVLLVVTSYINDLLLGKSPDSAAIVADFKANLVKGRAFLIADAEKRAARPWMLQHPNGAYTGTYENPQFGTMTIREEGGHLVATTGGVRSVLEAFTEPETARVELVPENGEVVRFRFAGGDKAASLAWGTDEFTRVNGSQ